MNLWILRILYYLLISKISIGGGCCHSEPCAVQNREIRRNIGFLALSGHPFARTAGYQPKSVRRTSSRVGIEADAPGRLTAIAAALLASLRASAAVFPRAMAAIK